MPGQVWFEPVPPFDVTDGTALTAATTLTAIEPNPMTHIVPYPWLHQFPGKRLEVQASGIYTTTGTQGTCTLGVYSGTVGQAIGSAVVLCSVAITWVASQTNRFWRAEGNISIRSVGTTGTGVAVLEVSNMSSGGTDIAATAAGATFTVDTSVARYFAIGATNSVASQSITCRYFGLRMVN
jgi:hypothetical protein